jgi:hypothetical protein
MQLNLRRLNNVHRDSRLRQLIGKFRTETGNDLPHKEKRPAVPARIAVWMIPRLLVGLFLAASLPLLSWSLHAQMVPERQMGPQAGSELYGTSPMASPSPASAETPAPLENLHIVQPVLGSMMASPPYGYAPLRVGFLVQAHDPEGLGFLTYSWNFGDGTVSSLPPETYISHTYSKPGSYVCELTATTVDGRKASLFQGVIVAPARQ